MSTMKNKIIELATTPISVNYKFKTIAAIAKELGISFYQCKKVVEENHLKIVREKERIMTTQTKNH